MENSLVLAQNWKKKFFIIWTGQAFSIIGSMLVQFALVWWLTQKTGSATVLATATLVSLLPPVLIGPFAGALVDRWNRRLVMIAADGSIALATLLLVLLFWSGQVQVWHVFVIGFIRAVGETFHYPAMQASTSLMVPEKHLSRVQGVNQTLNGALNIVAPPLGALLLSILPIYGVLAVDIVTAAIAIVPLLLVNIPQPERALQGNVTPRALLKDVREGLQYIAAWPGMLALLAVAALINFLFSPAFSLLPLLVTRIFNGQAMQLGVINSAWGVGVILGGLLLGVWGGFKRKVVTSMVGLVGMGLGTLLIGLAPGTMFPLAVAAMAVTGLLNPIVNGPLMALLQSRIPLEMQGRVFTVVASLSSAMAPLGMIAAAPVADRLGIRFWYVIAGTVCMGMGLASFFIRSIMHIEDATQPVPEGIDATPAD